MAAIDSPQAAARLARAIVSDIMLYNEDQVLEGLIHDTLFDLLGDEVEEGHNLYRSRVSETLHDRNYFYRAFVDAMKSKAHVKTKIW